MANQHSSKLGKGIDPKSMLGGLGLVVLGIGAAVATLTTGYTLSIMRIPLPPVVLAGIGGVVALLGVGVGVFALRQPKCVPCNRSLDRHDAYFPIEAADAVYHAATTLDAVVLGTIPLGSPADRHVQLSLESCPRCHVVGKLSLAAFAPARSVMIADTEVGGARLSSFAELVRQRDEQHEQRYEQS